MPESVKITDLPELSTVVPNDIIVVVDENETVTSRATLQQVKNLDCGPNTVKENAIANGNVTKSKLGYTDSNLLFYSGTNQANGKYTAEESTITAFGRSLVAAPNGTSARALINDSNTFTGQVKAEDGEPALPSYTFTSNPDTGLYMSPPGWPSLSSYGVPVLSANRDEGLMTVPRGGGIMLPTGAMRAMADFATTAASAGLYNNPFTLAYSFGFSNYAAPGYSFQQPSIANTPVNRQKLIDLEAQRGNTIVTSADGTTAATADSTTGWITQSPVHGNRTNFSSCGDNTHYHWDSTIGPSGAWKTLPACQNDWIAGYYYKAIGSILYNGTINVSGISYNNAGLWTLHFGLPMPDDNYAVAISTSSTSANFSVFQKTTATLTVYSSMTGSHRVTIAVLR